MTPGEKVAVNGITLNVVTAGDGPAVLLLHGFPDSSRLWRNQVPTLVDAGYRVIAPDLRGFGQSDRPEGVDAYSVINVVGDLTELLDHYGVDKAHVVGHDWGAGVSWVMAAFVPDRVASLTVLSVGRFQGAAIGYEQLQKSWYMFLFQFEGVAEEWITHDDWAFVRSWTGGGEDPEIYIRDLSRPGALTAALNYYRANLPPSAWIKDRANIPPIQATTMGIWSSEDIALDEKQMVESERFVAGGFRYERIEGAGHWIPLEAPDRLNELLLDFLGSVTATPSEAVANT